MNTKDYYVTHPDELDALLASNPKPITDQMAISMLKNTIVQAYIAQQIAAAVADLQGSPP